MTTDNQDLGERVAAYTAKQDALYGPPWTVEKIMDQRDEYDINAPCDDDSVWYVAHTKDAAIADFICQARNSTLVTDLWAEVERLRKEVEELTRRPSDEADEHSNFGLL